MRGRLRVACALAICCATLALGGGLWWHRRLVAPANPSSEIVGLVVDAPETLMVGEPLRVALAATGSADGLVTLAYVGIAGLKLYTAHLTRGRGGVVIPSSDTRQSGTATLIATAGRARASKSVELEPRPPVDPIVAFVGARSIIADGGHWCMAVVIPLDELGNVVAEGTTVELSVVHPDNVLEQIRTQVLQQLAWVRIYSGTLAGRSIVTASSGGMHGPEATFEEVPGWPVPFAIRASAVGTPADGRQLVTLRTDIVKDENGNPMLDGTLITFMSRAESGGSRFIPTYTIDGIAKASLQAPQSPMTLSVGAGTYGTASRLIPLDFESGPAVGAFPVQISVDRAVQSFSMRAGPLLGLLHQFVPDGLSVSGELTNALGQRLRINAVSDGGYARGFVRLRTLEPGDYNLDVELGSGHGTTTFHVD